MRFFYRFVAVSTVVMAFAVPAHAQMKKVAIAGWGPHPSLDATIEGFKQGMAEGGFTAGKNVEYDETNVNFDSALIPQMLNKLAAASPDLMVTIATPVSVMANQKLKSRKFPIVFTPIADPVHAHLVPDWKTGSPLMTGSSVALDYDAVLNFFQKVMPKLKRLAVLYDTGDDSSTTALESIEQVAGKHGISIVKIGVDNPSELPQRVQSAMGRADAIYPVASGRIQQGAAVISSTAERMKMPVLTTIPQMVQQGQAVAALAVSFKQSGEAAGRIAARILKGADPQSIPAWRPSEADHVPMISASRMKTLGWTLPAALKNCNCVVK